MTELDIQDWVYLRSGNQLSAWFDGKPLPDEWKAEIIEAIKNGDREDLEKAFPDLCPDAIKAGREQRQYLAIEEFVSDHTASEIRERAGENPDSDWELAIMAAISHGDRSDLESAYPDLKYANPAHMADQPQ